MLATKNLSLLDIDKITDIRISSIIIYSHKIPQNNWVKCESYAELFDPVIFYDAGKMNVQKIKCKVQNTLYEVQKWKSDKNKVFKIGTDYISFAKATHLDKKSSTKLMIGSNLPDTKIHPLISNSTTVSIKIEGKEDVFEILGRHKRIKKITNKWVLLFSKPNAFHIYLRGDSKSYTLFLNVRKSFVQNSWLYKVTSNEELFNWVKRYMDVRNKE